MATSNYLVEASSPAHSDDIWVLRHLPDGRVLSGSADGTLKLWDSSDPDTATQTFSGTGADGSKTQAIVGLDIEQNTAAPSFFIASSIDSIVARFSFSDTSPEASWKPPSSAKKPGQAWSISIHPDPSKETFATTGLGGVVRILSSNVGSFGEEKYAIQGKGDFVSVRYSPNGRVLGAVNSEGQVALYDAEDGQLVQYWMAHTGNIRSFAFAPDSSLLITGGDDKQINVYDIKGLLSVREEKQSNGYRSGNTAASNGNLRSRYSAVGQHVANLQGHNGWILDLSCRDDGKVFASSSSDGTIRLWDLQRPASACLAVLREHESDVWAVSWAPMPPSAHSIEGISGGGRILLASPRAPAHVSRARALHRCGMNDVACPCAHCLHDSASMTSAAMDDDDPWLDEDAGDASILQRNTTQEWDRLSSKFSDAGYREGISAGRASTVQAGFDEGYSVHGAPLGRELGHLRGLANGLLVLLTSTTLPLPQAASWAPGASGKDAAVEAARDLVRRLGKLRIQDIAPPDEEAERHAREHGEDALLPPELQEKREMESLEDGLEGILSSGGARQAPDGRLEMDACRTALQELLKQGDLQTLLSTSATDRPTTIGP